MTKREIKLSKRIFALKKQVADLNRIKDGAYAERNKLVALLSKIFPASIERHVGEDWEDDWRNVVFIWLPTGQATWHIHDSELSMFSHLKSKGWEWDGHTTDEKYHRVLKIPSRQEVDKPIGRPLIHLGGAQ